jgi:hypothetical protein
MRAKAAAIISFCRIETIIELYLPWPISKEAPLSIAGFKFICMAF